jgi:mono/diheme cytochrome c family protein
VFGHIQMRYRPGRSKARVDERRQRHREERSSITCARISTRTFERRVPAWAGRLLYSRGEGGPRSRRRSGGNDLVALDDDVPTEAAAGLRDEGEGIRREAGIRAGRRLRGTALLLALAGLIAASPERAERTASAPGSEGSPGRILYLTHCQGCHGGEGRGDGPAAASLRTRPTDLTRLWQRYGTPLDRRRLAAYIDGRGLLEVHGPRTMPLWGDEFFEDAPPLTPNLVEGAKQHLIAVLVDYLESIQTERRS